MSRAATGDVITVKPSNNIYTVLTIVAVLAQLVALGFLWMKHQALFDKGLF